jgi:uncharacterized RDD family membrane protein YckC
MTAFAVDALIALVPFWLALPVCALLVAGGGAEQLSGWFVAVMGLGFSLLLHASVQTIQAVRREPTPGQRLMRLRLVRDAAEVGFKLLLVREVAWRAVTWPLIFGLGLFPLLAIDAVWALIDNDHSTLRDRLCGTTIVRAPVALAP